MTPTPLDFLLDLVINTYLMIVILRVWLQIARADFYNPFSQFITKATNPFLLPMRRVIPGFLGIDMAGVVLALVIIYLKISLLFLISGNNPLIQKILELGNNQFDPLFFFLAGVLFFFKKIGLLIFWLLLIRAIMSFVSQGRHPVEQVMAQLLEPLLSPIRRRLPDMGGLDLSLMALSTILIFTNMCIGYYLTPYISPIWVNL